MPLQTLATTLAAAERGGYAVGAFNVSDLNQSIAVLDAARAERSPVIVQAIAGTSAYRDESWWWHMLRTVVASYTDVTHDSAPGPRSHSGRLRPCNGPRVHQCHD